MLAWRKRKALEAGFKQFAIRRELKPMIQAHKITRKLKMPVLVRRDLLGKTFSSRQEQGELYVQLYRQLHIGRHDLMNEHVGFSFRSLAAAL